MDESIKFFVGLDTHKDSITVAVCEAGREASRFVASWGRMYRGCSRCCASTVQHGKSAWSTKPDRWAMGCSER